MHTTAPEHTAEHYQIQATIALDNCNYELAKQILDKAANIHVSNPFILELLGIAEMECASLFQYDESKSYIDRAIACFYESIQIAPNVGYAKYLYLGQFTCGLESLAYSEKGLIILEKQYLQSFDIDVQSLDTITLRRKLAQTLCSIVESDELDAESRCETYIQKALNYDPQNSEVYQSLASILLCQCKTNEASDAILKAVTIWIHTDSTSPQWPSLNVRVAQSKILIETKNYEQALQVIKTCQQENDEDIETWYLYGWCYFLIVCGDDNEMNKDLEQCTDTQLDTLEDARDCFVYLLQIFEKSGEVDSGLIEHSYSLIAFTNNQLVKQGREQVETDGIVQMEDLDGILDDEWEDDSIAKT